MDNGVCPLSLDTISLVSTRLTQKEYIARIIEEQRTNGIDDPLMIADIDEVVDRYRRWCRVFPRVKPFYAVKCNNDAVVLTVLADLGCCFDCASKGEIQQILDMGVDTSRIVYANTCKQSSHVTYAKDNNVALMTFDNEDELIKIKNLYPSARLLLRFRPDHHYKVNSDLGKKFGCDLNSVRRLLLSAKNKDLNVVGVSFHVGSNCRDAMAYKIAMEQSKMIFDIGQEFGFNMTVLDIGGGYPGRDVDSPTVEEQSVIINENLDEYFPDTGGLEIIAEPGRYFVESVFSAGVCVIGRNVLHETPEEKHDESNGDIMHGATRGAGDAHSCRTPVIIFGYCEAENDICSVMYTINDGMYGSFNWVFLRAETFEIAPIKEKTQQRRYSSIIWGPTMDDQDYLTMNYSLPLMDMDDWAHVSYAGSYSLPARSNFNSMPHASLTYFCSCAVWTALKGMHTCNTCK